MDLIDTFLNNNRIAGLWCNHRKRKVCSECCSYCLSVQKGIVLRITPLEKNQKIKKSKHQNKNQTYFSLNAFSMEHKNQQGLYIIYDKCNRSLQYRAWRYMNKLNWQQQQQQKIHKLKKKILKINKLHFTHTFTL